MVSSYIKKIMVQRDQYKWQVVKRFKWLALVYNCIEFFLAPLRKKVVDCCDLPKGARVLDVACGTGSQCIAFAKRGFSVVGVDLSPDMLVRAQKKIKKGYDITFLCHDATNLPYEDAWFDLAVISFGLHEMPEEIGTAVLREMKRVTKENGKVIIVDYHRPENGFSAFPSRIVKIWESPYYEHFLKTCLQAYLDKVGFVVQNRQMHFFGIFQAVVCKNE